MKRRGFLGWLAAAPVAAVAAKEAVKTDDHLALIKKSIEPLSVPYNGYDATMVTCSYRTTQPTEWKWSEGEAEFEEYEDDDRA